nr:MAG TPA: hypothetical protein [Caudoviricetes sp.]
MRKLDYLRNKVKKAKYYDELIGIKLPKEFRWKNDIMDPFYNIITDVTNKEVVFHIIHVKERCPNTVPNAIEYDWTVPLIKTESEDFKFHTKKDFDFMPKGLKKYM